MATGRKAPSDPSEHVLLLRANFALRGVLAKQKEHFLNKVPGPLVLPAEEWVAWKIQQSVLHLIQQLRRMRLCRFYLNSKGKVGRADPGWGLRTTEQTWIEYNMGYFYALHRSIYDCSLALINEACGLNFKTGAKLEAQVLKACAKHSAVHQALAKIKASTWKYKEHRDGHIHRGQEARTEPLVGGQFVDLMAAAVQMDEMAAELKFPIGDPKEASQNRLMLRYGKRMLLQEINDEIGRMGSCVWQLFDSLRGEVKARLPVSAEDEALLDRFQLRKK